MDYEIISDHKTVWVNDSDGMCVARFGLYGSEIHNDTNTQLKTGKECISCYHGITTIDSWNTWINKVYEIFGLKISFNAIPKILKSKIEKC